MTYTRKEIRGGVPARELAGTINASVTTIVIDDATAWPDGNPGPFVIAINRGSANEERILCESRSGTTITVVDGGRGYDNTAASIHQSGSPVEHVLDAITVDQVNRLANLLNTVGGLIVFNGTNPVQLAGPAGDGSDDNKVLLVNAAEPTRLQFALLQTVTVDPSAPSPSAAIRLWYDETTNRIRASDGAEWLASVPLFVFATTAARDAALPSPTPGDMCIVNQRIVERYTSGLGWRPIGIPEFATVGDRDAYYSSPYDGAQAYVTGTSTLWTRRGNEWIRGNVKITQSASQPSNPQTGDIWIQPN